MFLYSLKLEIRWITLDFSDLIRAQTHDLENLNLMDAWRGSFKTQISPLTLPVNLFIVQLVHQERSVWSPSFLQDYTPSSLLLWTGINSPDALRTAQILRTLPAVTRGQNWESDSFSRWDFKVRRRRTVSLFKYYIWKQEDTTGRCWWAQRRSWSRSTCALRGPAAAATRSRPASSARWARRTPSACSRSRGKVGDLNNTCI